MKFFKKPLGPALVGLFIIGCNLQSAEDLWQISKSNLELGRFEAASQNLLVFIKSYPDHPEVDWATFNLASVNHLQLDNLSLATDYYLRLVQSPQKSAYYDVALEGLIDIYKNRIDDSRKLIEFLKLLVANTKGKTNRFTHASLRLAAAYYDQQLYQQGQEVLKTVIEQLPANPDYLVIIDYAYFKIGYGFEKMRLSKLAELAYQEGIAKTNGEPEALLCLLRIAELYSNQQKIAQSKQAFMAALARMGQDSPLYAVYQQKIANLP